MPPPHIPQANERAVLQKLGLMKAVRLDQLYPAGKQLFARMVAKGWITKQDDGRTYSIPSLGRFACGASHGRRLQRDNRVVRGVRAS